MTTEQVAELLFPIPAGLRKAQQRLKRLYDQGRLGRTRLEAGYCYYAGTRPGQADHLTAVNWIRLWLSQRKYEAIERWEYEAVCGGVRADGLCLLRNTWTGERQAWFVELDRSVSHNGWRKAAAYGELYASGRYDSAWWVPLVKRFPAVLCVADSPAKLAEIRREIDQGNPQGLRFEVRLLADLIGEVRQ
jgi:hypothetical protein